MKMTNTSPDQTPSRPICCMLAQYRKLHEMVALRIVRMATWGISRAPRRVPSRAVPNGAKGCRQKPGSRVNVRYAQTCVLSCSRAQYLWRRTTQKVSRSTWKGTRHQLHIIPAQKTVRKLTVKMGKWQWTHHDKGYKRQDGSGLCNDLSIRCEQRYQPALQAKLQ